MNTEVGRGKIMNVKNKKVYYLIRKFSTKKEKSTASIFGTKMKWIETDYKEGKKHGKELHYDCYGKKSEL